MISKGPVQLGEEISKSEFWEAGAVTAARNIRHGPEVNCGYVQQCLMSPVVSTDIDKNIIEIYRLSLNSARNSFNPCNYYTERERKYII